MIKPISTCNDALVSSLRLCAIGVGKRSNWSFLKLEMSDGSVGWGELTLRSHEAVLSALLDTLEPALRGKPLDQLHPYRHAYPGLPSGRAGNAVLSAFDQCCCDLTGQYLNRPIHHLWGNGSSRRLKAYATVNRSVLQRTPKGFAESCSAAVRAGFGGIKIMPFDAVTPQSASTAEGAAELKEAVRRLQAVRDAIGPEVSLMADCHWRLDVPRAMDLIDALADINLHWLECPVPESNERCRSVKDLRRHANRRGMLLAGGENVFSRDGAWPYITQGLYDVIMPDIKYCGGYSEFSAIAELASRHAVRVSPHNPSGPIAHAHTVQICAALGLEEAVEQQFAESHLFGTAVTGTAPRFIDGHFTVPTEPGLGLALDETVSSKHPYSHIPLSINDPSFAGSTGE